MAHRIYTTDREGSTISSASTLVILGVVNVCSLERSSLSCALVYYCKGKKTDRRLIEVERGKYDEAIVDLSDMQSTRKRLQFFLLSTRHFCDNFLSRYILKSNK